MNRKQFIQSHGATCSNWTWSWSFVNHNARFVIFGIWQDHADDKLGLILHVDWQYLGSRKQSGYGQALEHIRLVKEEGYGLRTFRMRGVSRNPERGDNSPSTITEFSPVLTKGRLIELSDSWHVAFDAAYETIAEIVELHGAPSELFEGSVSSVLVNVYERNPEARRACLAHFGTSCQACGTNFGEVYGSLGAGYIHVHHIRPIHLCGGEYKVDPITDLIPVCANCHAMIHRTRDPLKVADLREILKTQSHKASDQSTS